MAGRPVGFSDDRSARFCKTFNCNLRSNWQGAGQGKGKREGSQIARVATVALQDLLLSGLSHFGSPSSHSASKCRTRRLSVATAIEEFHFETFNFQRAMLNGRQPFAATPERGLGHEG